EAGNAGPRRRRHRSGLARRQLAHVERMQAELHRQTPEAARQRTAARRAGGPDRGQGKQIETADQVAVAQSQLERAAPAAGAAGAAAEQRHKLLAPETVGPAGARVRGSADGARPPGTW